MEPLLGTDITGIKMFCSLSQQRQFQDYLPGKQMWIFFLLVKVQITAFVSCFCRSVAQGEITFINRDEMISDQKHDGRFLSGFHLCQRLLPVNLDLNQQVP